MKVHVHIHVHDERRQEVLEAIAELRSSFMSGISNLRREVQENRDLTASAVQLLNGLGQMIRDNIGNDAALQELANDLDAQQQQLASAVAANTPAAPGGPTQPPGGADPNQEQ